MTGFDHKGIAFETGLLAQGYVKGDPGAFDRARAMFPDALWAWLEATPPEELKRLHAHYGANAEGALLDRLDQKLKRKGVVVVLREGLRLVPTSASSSPSSARLPV